MSLTSAGSILTFVEYDRAEELSGKGTWVKYNTLIVQMKNWGEYHDWWQVEGIKFDYGDWGEIAKLKTFKLDSGLFGKLRFINPVLWVVVKPNYEKSSRYYRRNVIWATN